MTRVATVSWLKPPWSWSAAASSSFSRPSAWSRAFSFVSRSFSLRSDALSIRSESISVIALTTPETLSATSASAPWNGRSANENARCASWMYGLAENAISSRVIAIRIANTIPRRRVWRLDRIWVMTRAP